MSQEKERSSRCIIDKLWAAGNNSMKKTMNYLYKEKNK